MESLRAEMAPAGVHVGASATRRRHAQLADENRFKPRDKAVAGT